MKLRKMNMIRGIRMFMVSFDSISRLISMHERKLVQRNLNTAALTIKSYELLCCQLPCENSGSSYVAKD